MQFTKSAELLKEASEHLAGGVSSHFRLGMMPHPLVFDRGDGPYLIDVDGNRLIDYYLGMGPMILGHTPTPVIEAVQSEIGNGLLFAGQSRLEYSAADLVCEMVPCAERIRFGSSGSEVAQAAIRLARAATGRKVIIKFEGHYHGWFDNVIWSVGPTSDQFGSSESPTPVPASAGQEEESAANLVVLRWNDLASLETRLAEGDVAGVIMEPAMCNTSAVPPLPGYLEGAKAACAKHGTVLIFDEVITGFRLAPGGAQERFGVTPDLAIFGKAIASGFPVSCLAGKAGIMDLLASRKVMHGGTYNAGVAAMAATRATLTELRQPGFYERLEATGMRLWTGIDNALTDAEVPHRIQGFGSVFHVALGTTGPITDYRTSLAADRASYIRFTTALLQRGVRALERGAWFVSSAHTDDVIDATVAAVAEAAKGLADG